VQVADYYLKFNIIKQILQFIVLLSRTDQLLK